MDARSIRAAAAVVVSAAAMLGVGDLAAAEVDFIRPPLVLESGVRGVIGISTEGHLEERFRVPRQLLAELQGLRPGASLQIQGWPVAPGDHRNVRFERRPIYGNEARIFEVGEHGVRELPRSSHVHFLGAIENDEDGGVLLVLEPRTGRLTGAAHSNGSGYDLVAAEFADVASVRLVATDERVAPLDPIWDCGGETLHLPESSWIQTAGLRAPPGAKSGAALEAVIAVDTDTELLSQKFGNNTVAATDYIADLFAAMNVMYARDLGVTLLQGTTYLRVGSDPYSQNSGGSASGAELQEFGSYWKTHYQSVDRSLAAMLSGKSPSSNSASGIAWVGTLCSTSYGYSFSKVFKMNYLAGDAKVVGHEIGHNFGSPHTHCYSPPVDLCWNGEGGCYSGATSCPGGPGTIMSYCHRVGCGSTMNFHPTVVSRILDNHVAPATGVCVFEASQSGDGIFADGFEGGIGSWSASAP